MYVPYTYECVLAHEISKIRTTRCQAMAKNSLKKFATRTLYVSNVSLSEYDISVSISVHDRPTDLSF